MNDTTRTRLLAAIRRIHEAGMAPETWPDALESVAECMGARRATLFGIDLRQGAAQEVRTANIDPSGGEQFAAYYHRLDPWVARYNPSWPAGQVFQGTRLVPDSLMRGTEFYNDFLKPLDIRYGFGGFPTKTGAWMDVMSVFRGVRQNDFDGDSPQLYSILVEHAAQALEVQRMIGNLRARANGLATALEQVTRAVTLLDRRRRVVYANPAAETLLAAGDGLTVRHGVLRATGEGAALNQCFQRADAVAATGSKQRRRAVTVNRPSGSRPYTVRVAPVALPEDMVELDPCSDRARYLVMITDPDAERPVPAAGELRVAYGLTRAEAGLAVDLVRGATVAEIAERRDIALDTARKRLKSVFEKTETHRQSELVQRLIMDFGWP